MVFDQPLHEAIMRQIPAALVIGSIITLQTRWKLTSLGLELYLSVLTAEAIVNLVPLQYQCQFKDPSDVENQIHNEIQEYLLFDIQAEATPRLLVMPSTGTCS